jgi:hypothetical protein
VNGRDGRATVRFSKRAEVEPVFSDVADGIVRSVSVGYVVHQFSEQRGAAGTPPVRLATDWEPYELSLVPIPADAGAQIRDAGSVLHRCELVSGPPAEDRERLRRHANALLVDLAWGIASDDACSRLYAAADDELRAWMWSRFCELRNV